SPAHGETASPVLPRPLAPPTRAPRRAPARSALRESYISTPRRGPRDRGAARPLAYVWLLRPPQPAPTPASSSSLCFRAGRRSATRWSSHAARRKECAPCRSRSSSGRRGHSPVAVAITRDRETPGQLSRLQANPRETPPEPLRAILPP